MSSIIIDRTKYEKPIPFYDARGIKIILHLPANFIPNSAMGRYLESDDCFEIKFNYGDEEPEDILFEDNNVRFVVGKNTKKLLAIFIKSIKAKKIDTIKIEQRIKEDLLTAFDNAINRVNRPIEKTNFEVTKTIISESTSNLIEALSV
jgi:hypothetical protein